MAKRPESNRPIGELIREHRVEVLKRGLRATAEMLGVAAPHLTDIEKGRRTPSEELMLRIAQVYGLPVARLRAGWSRAESSVTEAATSSETNAAKVPQFLRTAGNLSPEQWDALILQADHMSKSNRNKKKG